MYSHKLNSNKIMENKIVSFLSVCVCVCRPPCCIIHQSILFFYTPSISLFLPPNTHTHTPLSLSPNKRKKNATFQKSKPTRKNKPHNYSPNHNCIKHIMTTIYKIQNH
mmetsp:Transcript_5817/g.8569  ORF Transcript_5817/g.8569 Transcript_5817/m.8569 type:complete len:108 (-) Transcript_5817:987-1310(-)